MLKNSKTLLIVVSLIGFSTALIAEQGMQGSNVPNNIADFTCQDFAQKSQNCESYTCQTPSILDPTLQTSWEIVEKKNNRCVIKFTNSDVGLKDEYGEPKPITKSCEYDEAGIAALNNLMDELNSGYFNSMDAGDIKGARNCSLTSDGVPLKPDLPGM